ncbi:MAG: ribonuclease domain-containing protein [Gammaproteobacteria bacterium]
MRRLALPLLLAAIVAAFMWQSGTQPSSVPVTSTTHDSTVPEKAANRLPAEAQAVIRLIAQGGPFPYRQDGTVFQNREGRLPEMVRGYYREYTVPTPGARDRGARRLITGGTPPQVWYYTADHYGSFHKLNPEEVAAQ